MIRRVLFYLLFFLFSMSGLAGIVQFDSIQIGHNVPDISFFATTVDSKLVSSIDKYRGMLLVLDFWDSGCGSCMASFPNLERLNNQYKGKAFILPVTRNSYKVLSDLRGRSQIMRESGMSYVLEDSILHYFFPHKFVPHYVWIDRHGSFIGTSGTIDSSAIAKVLTTGKLPASISNSRHSDHPILYANFDSVARNMQLKEFGSPYYSSIDRVLKPDFNRTASVMQPVWDDTTKKRVIGFRYYGYYLIDLVKFAYGIRQNGDMVLGDDSLSCLFPPKEREKLDVWQADKLYTYAFWSDSMSAFDVNSKKLIMRKDIEEAFDITVCFKEVERYCYVLGKREVGEISKFAVNETEIHSKSGRNEITLNGIYAKNVKMSVFLRSLYYSLNKFNRFELPIINNTGISSNKLVDIYIKVGDVKDINSFDKALSEIGLTIKKEIVKSQFFVLSKGERVY